MKPKPETYADHGLSRVEPTSEAYPILRDARLIVRRVPDARKLRYGRIDALYAPTWAVRALNLPSLTYFRMRDPSKVFVGPGMRAVIVALFRECSINPEMRDAIEALDAFNRRGVSELLRFARMHGIPREAFVGPPDRRSE